MATTRAVVVGGGLEGPASALESKRQAYEEAHIEATFEALRAQDYPNLTITVVNYQSTDSHAAILDRLADETGVRKPIRFVRGVQRPESWVGKRGRFTRA